MVEVRVSNLELFRQYRQDEELELEELLSRLRGEQPPSEAMKAGTALHAAIELIEEGDTAELAADGYRFYFQCEAKIELPRIREKRLYKQYGDLMVTGQMDAINGNAVTDYKTTGYFDPDRYLEGYQWRFYLDLTGCDWFFWKVFVLKAYGDLPDGTHTYEITQFHELSQHRYEGIEADCARLAADYLEFVHQIGEKGGPN